MVRDKQMFGRDITLACDAHAWLLFAENTMACETCFPKSSYQ